MTTTLEDIAEERIRKLITSGYLLYGDKVSFRRLAKVIEIGVMPVQHALERLQEDGWVEIVNSPAEARGTYITYKPLVS